MLMGDHPHFPRGRPSAFLDQRVGRNTLTFQKVTETPASRIASDGAKGHRPASESSDVCGHIAGATCKFLRTMSISYQHHWHRRFRRDARGVSTKEFIQHKIAQNANHWAAKAAHDTSEM